MGKSEEPGRIWSGALQKLCLPLAGLAEHWGGRGGGRGARSGGGGDSEQQKRPGPGLAQSGQNSSGQVSPELLQHSQLCPQVLPALQRWGFQKTQGTREIQPGLYPKSLICGLLSIPAASF